MRVGVDFDNTIAIYDELWHRCGRALGLPAHVAPDKAAVRAWFWSQPEGNTPWTELQGIVYGQRIAEAQVAEGFLGFLRAARAAGVAVSIISHKTRYPALGPRVDLRQAAAAFLEAQGVFDLGVARERVFWNDTQADKVARVGSEGCAAFVDDLPKVFADPGFPAGVERVLFDRAGTQEAGAGVVSLRSWAEVQARLL